MTSFLAISLLALSKLKEFAHSMSNLKTRKNFSKSIWLNNSSIFDTNDLSILFKSQLKLSHFKLI